MLGDFSVDRAPRVRRSTGCSSSARSGVMMNRPLEQRWEGPYSPPDPRMLDRVFVALVDPLDQSLWMVTSNGWLNFQPALELWQRRLCLGDVRAMAIDEDDPAGGIRLRHERGLVPGDERVAGRGALQAAGAAAAAGHRRGRAGAPTHRSAPTRRSRCAMRAGVRRTFTSAAPIARWPGLVYRHVRIGLLFIRPGDATPERRSFGLTGDTVGALFSSPGGVWVATDRTDRIDATLTYVTSDLSRSDNASRVVRRWDWDTPRCGA